MADHHETSWPPLISAVMPAFNAARSIEASIRSIQHQTLGDWELICVDDGSSDATADVVRSIADADDRIIVCTIDHRGRGAARNVALQVARGRYIALCDADDLSRPQRFARQRAALDAHPDLFAVGAGLAPFSDETDVARLGARHWPAHSDDIARRFSQLRMAVPNCAVMMRADDLALIGSYDETLDRCQDLDLFLRAHWLGFRFQNLPDVLVDYRQDGRVQSFDYYRANAVHHARVIRKHSHGLKSMNPFALVHRLGPFVHRPRYAMYRVKRRIREGAI